MRKIVKTLILLWMGTLAATAQTIHVEEVTLSRGYEAEIPVSYDFKESYYGLQMDFTLPEGIFLDSCQLGQGVREAGYQLYHALLKSGKHRILASNMQLQPMAPGQGELLRLFISSDPEMAMDTYAIAVSYLEVTDANGQAVVLANEDALLNVLIEVNDQDDFQDYLDWLAREARKKMDEANNPDEEDPFQALLYLNAQIPMDETASQPEHSDLTIDGGAFLPVTDWSSGAVFEIPQLSTFTLLNNTLDCNVATSEMVNNPAKLAAAGKALLKGDTQPLTLFDVTGTLHLGEGSTIKGRKGGTTLVSIAENAKLYLDGATINDVTLLLNNDLNVFVTKPLAGNVTVKVPENNLQEGFRIMAPTEGHAFTLKDAMAVTIANSDEWGAEVDDEGYLSLFPLSKLGDVNCDGQVTVTDAALIVQKILGEEVTVFREAAANVVRDGSISISDAQQIVEMILK